MILVILFATTLLIPLVIRHLRKGEQLIGTWLTIFGVTHILAPALQYAYLDQLEITFLFGKQMPIGRDDYFAVVMPAFLIAVFAGIILCWAERTYKPITSSIEVDQKLSSSKYLTVLLALTALGAIIPFVPLPLPSPFLWVMQHAYWAIPSFFYYTSQTKKARILIVICTLYSSTSGMIQEGLLLSLTTLILFDDITKKKFQVAAAIGLIGPAFIGILLLKSEYRSLGEKDIADSVSFYASSLQYGASVLMEPQMLTQESFFEANRRLNQGWLVAHAIDHRMKHGTEQRHLFKAYASSILPRFLYPDKIDAGGSYNITRFTDVKLNDSTSMNIGVLGEHIVASQGIVFYLTWSVFVCFLFLIFNRTTRIAKVSGFSPFLPLFLFYLLKSETDIASVFGHFVKNGIALWVIYRVFIFRR